MRKVSTHEAKTHLSRLLAEVQAGEEVVICRGDRPAARLVPFEAQSAERRRPKVGTRTSPAIRYTDDAFEPLSPPELADWGV